MSKIRIYELAKQLNVANKDLMEKIHSVGIEAKSHMGMLTEEDAAKVAALYQPAKDESKKKKIKKVLTNRKVCDTINTTGEGKAVPQRERPTRVSKTYSR